MFRNTLSVPSLRINYLPIYAALTSQKNEDLSCGTLWAIWKQSCITLGLSCSWFGSYEPSKTLANAVTHVSVSMSEDGHKYSWMKSDKTWTLANMYCQLCPIRKLLSMLHKLAWQMYHRNNKTDLEKQLALRIWLKSRKRGCVSRISGIKTTLYLKIKHVFPQCF
jgi:hypothetical protein